MNNDRFKTKSPCVQSRKAYAIVIGKSAQKHPREAPFPQIACKSRRRRPVVLKKCRVRIDLASEPLTQNELSSHQLQISMKLRSLAPLYAMIRPQHLRPVSHFNSLVRLLARMSAGERGVTSSVPVLREDDVFKSLCDPTNRRNDLVSASNSQSSTRTEVVLYVDHQQYVLWLDLHIKA